MTLHAVREQEWRKAGELIGASSMTNLGYRDGCLCNTSLETICESLVTQISDRAQNYDADTEVELMSIDLNGVTGHIDHIVAGRAACCAFYQAKGYRFTRKTHPARVHPPLANADRQHRLDIYGSGPKRARNRRSRRRETV